MHLVGPLAAGVAGAGNGTANLYVRGTLTAATYYLDFEATQPATAALQLDANGRKVCYVNQLVDLVVADSDGEEVLRCVAGAGAPAVEVISQSFTGVDYVSSATGAGKPTTLKTVLDRWTESAGAVDWKVLTPLGPVDLEQFAGAVSGMFYNVLDPAFGAVGDGITDDTSAIQAALTSAALNGGTVVLPPGTYRTTAQLVIGSGANLVGTGGQAATIISLDHATDDIISIGTVDIDERIVISGLTLTHQQANAGQMIEVVNDNSRLVLQDIFFRPFTGYTGICLYEVATTGCQIRLFRCDFRMLPGNDAVQSASAELWATHCRTYWAATSAYTTTAWTLLGVAMLVGNRWDGALVTSGTPTLLSLNSASTEPSVMVANDFACATAATVSLTGVTESATRANSNITFTVVGGTSTAAHNSVGYSGIDKILRTATNSLSAHTMPEDCGTYVLTNTFAGAFQVTTPSFVLNKRVRLYVHNNDGTNRAITWGLGSGVAVIRPSTGPTVNANTISVFDLHAVYWNGFAGWIITTPLANEAE